MLDYRSRPFGHHLLSLLVGCLRVYACVVNIKVELLTTEQWVRAKNLRLESLRDSAHAFGGNLELESAQIESEWRAKFEKLSYLVASVDELCRSACSRIRLAAARFGRLGR